MDALFLYEQQIMGSLLSPRHSRDMLFFTYGDPAAFVAAKAIGALMIGLCVAGEVASSPSLTREFTLLSWVNFAIIGFLPSSSSARSRK